MQSGQGGGDFAESGGAVQNRRLVMGRLRKGGGDRGQWPTAGVGLRWAATNL